MAMPTEAMWAQAAPTVVGDGVASYSAVKNLVAIISHGP